jgi:DNA-binding CsgD family transcriptional regulator
MTDAKLTPKQQQVFGLLDDGKKVPEIAKQMKISPSGVYGHMRRIRQLGVKLPTETIESNGGGAAGRRRRIEMADGIFVNKQSSLPNTQAHLSNSNTLTRGSAEDVIQEEVSDAQARIEEISSEIDDHEAKAQELGREKDDLIARVERLDAAAQALA